MAPCADMHDITVLFLCTELFLLGGWGRLSHLSTERCGDGETGVRSLLFPNVVRAKMWRRGGERQRGERQGANKDRLGNKIKYKKPNVISTNKTKP